MSPSNSVVRTIEVPVDPATAFEAFTEEIGAWYRPGPYSWNYPERALGIRFEPGVGGRLVEVHDEATGEGFEMGRILLWEPGARLVFGFRSVFFPPEPMTEVEVRFEAVGGGTRVTLEHRGLDGLPPEFVKTFEGRAWVAFMGWFREHMAGRGVAGAGLAGRCGVLQVSGERRSTGARSERRKPGGSTGSTDP